MLEHFARSHDTGDVSFAVPPQGHLAGWMKEPQVAQLPDPSQGRREAACIRPGQMLALAVKQ